MEVRKQEVSGLGTSRSRAKAPGVREVRAHNTSQAPSCAWYKHLGAVLCEFLWRSG